MSDPREGKVLQGRYRLVSLLAEGGMGVVWRGERVGIGRPVVVKFLHAVLSDKPGIIDRFEREARATARLNHPNCVALVDFGIDEEAPYLVVEYVEGETLADLLDHGPVPPARAVHIARQILAGLEHAHERGILHRDLKPANVMIVKVEGYSGDFVKILDFGLAKLAWPGEDKRDVTVEGIAIGTPGYMSPEQAAGVPSDQRSDIYCAGALLYHLVTGSKVFDGDDVRSVLRRHREETPPSPREVQPTAGISKQLELVIERAMRRDPNKRFQSAGDMAAALDVTPEARKAGRRATSAVDVTVAEAPRSRARRRAGGRRLIWFGSSLVLATALIALGYACLWPRRSAATLPPVVAPAVAPRESAPHPVPAHELARLADLAAKPDAASTALAVAPPDGAALSTAVAPVPAAPGAATVVAPPAVPLAGEGTKADVDSGTIAGERRTVVDAGSGAVEEEEPEGAAKDDGSSENDHAEPPPPAAVTPQAAPTVHNLAGVRALLKHGDAEAALAALLRLRKLKQPPARASEMARLIGNLYFDRRWWTDGLREYRFAITLDTRARQSATLIDNSVHALTERTTYPRARRLILDYIGRGAMPSLRRASRSGQPPVLRRRAQSLLEALGSKSYRLPRHRR